MNVSVIIPLYNKSDYIGQCLHSLACQSYQDFEIILVNDCSTDDSLNIVQEFVSMFDNRLNIVNNEKNLGFSASNNVGLLKATGIYVYFMDADDWLEEDALYIYISAFNQSHAQVVYNQSYYSINNTETKKMIITDHLLAKRTLVHNDILYNLDALLNKGEFRNAWTKMCRRDFLINNNIKFPETAINGEDYIYVIDVYSKAKHFVRINKPVYNYRNYNESNTRKHFEKNPQEAVVYWLNSYLKFYNSLLVMADENNILRENHYFVYKAAYLHLMFILSKMSKDHLSDVQIYQLLKDTCFELNEDFSLFILSLLVKLL